MNCQMAARWFLFLILMLQPPTLQCIETVKLPFQLSLEEKIGQLLIVHFHGEEANEEARFLIQELHVGGIIYYNWSNGLHDPHQVARLSQGLQQMALNSRHPIPLLIATDQEGGAVSRLKNGFTRFPSNFALAQTGNFVWGKECARVTAVELAAVGISLNLAPVVDVYTNPTNPVIGIRSFSSKPEQVSRWGRCFLAGYHAGGIVAALKHFPGHGDTTVDSHEALPVIKKSRIALDQCELLPFRELAGESDAILTAHLMIPALDHDHCVTFSKAIIQDLLRKELHFEGVVITDSLAMQGILDQVESLEEAALKSLEAGHDLLLLGGKQLLDSQKGLEFSVERIKRVHRFLVDSVKRGRLSEKQIDQSLARILALKQKAGLFAERYHMPENLEAIVGTSEHRKFAEQVTSTTRSP